jgi:DHA2 family methylenomycin A resistance protein-like MFS transporter
MKGVDLDPAARDEATDLLASGDLSVIAGLPENVQGTVRDAVAPIFTDGLQIGFTAAALGTIIGGLLALVILPSRKKMAETRAAAAAASAPTPAADASRAASV